MRFLPENDSLIDSHLHSSLGYCANTNWLDADLEDSGQMKLPKGQCNAMKRRKIGLSEAKNGFHVHDSDIMQSFERKNSLSSVSSSLKTCLSPLMCHQNIFPRADSSNHSYQYGYRVKIENGHVTQQSSVKKSAACVESEVRSNIAPPCEVSVDINNHGQQSMESAVDALLRLPAMMAEDTDKISHKKRSHVPLDIEKTCENFMCQVSSSNQVMLQNVFSDDISMASASFRKLQDVLDQLDIRTKSCIRDGLYRLARNAEMRHCIDSIKHNRTGSSISSRTARTDKSKQSSEFIVETGTNLIDRSVAHLLFYRASDSSSSPINYAMSHESRIRNEQNHGSSTMPNNA